MGCPQVVLFGRAPPSLYRPWGTAGAEVLVLRGEIDGEPNMLGIETRSVIAAWTNLKLRAALRRRRRCSGRGHRAGGAAAAAWADLVAAGVRAACPA